MSEEIKPLLVTAVQARKMLGMSKSLFSELCRSGKFTRHPATKRNCLFRIEQIIAFADEIVPKNIKDKDGKTPQK